jgi:predicted RNase H-like HicB family nuclease
MDARTALAKNGSRGRTQAHARAQAFWWHGAMIFHVTLAKAEDGWIVAECPALPGCVSQGKDEQEALSNIREAIAAWLWAEHRKAAERTAKAGEPEILVTV